MLCCGKNEKNRQVQVDEECSRGRVGFVILNMGLQRQDLSKDLQAVREM